MFTACLIEFRNFLEMNTDTLKNAETSKEAQTDKTNLAMSSINCLKCDKSYGFPAEKDDYLAHLFLQHRLIIADVEDISLLDNYLQYWQPKFKSMLKM